MNAEAQCWKAWYLDPDNQAALDATTLGAAPKMNQFLANRLHRAFINGFARGRAAERADVENRFKKIIGGRE